MTAEAVEYDIYDDSLQGNDFKSARDDHSRSHYVIVGSVMREYSMITNLDTALSLGSRFVKTRARLAFLTKAVTRAGLPLAVAAEANSVYLEMRRLLRVQGRFARAWWLAAVIIAMRRRGIPVTREAWYDLAASLLDLPSDRSKWTEDDERRVREAIKLANKAIRKMEAMGVYVPSIAADPFEAIPDAQLRYHALRIYKELKDLGLPSGPAARYLSLYLASVAANRPFTTLTELTNFARKYIRGTSQFVRKAARDVLQRVVLDVTLAPADRTVRLNGTNGEADDLEHVATLRLRCSVCGHTWTEEVYVHSAGVFKLGAVGATIASAVCPGCGTRLGRVVEFHVTRAYPGHTSPHPPYTLPG